LAARDPNSRRRGFARHPAADVSRHASVGEPPQLSFPVAPGDAASALKPAQAQAIEDIKKAGFTHRAIKPSRASEDNANNIAPLDAAALRQSGMVVRFAIDSPLEQEGFELAVPLANVLPFRGMGTVTQATGGLDAAVRKNVLRCG
jgi:hypothetical protein